VNVKEENRKILAIMDSYVHAFEMADVDLMQSLHWVDDPNFTEIEDIISEPFSRDGFLSIMDCIRRERKPRRKMKFYDTKVSVLSPEIAYIISYQEIRSSKEEKVNTSRVSLIFLKKANEWKIIHGHFSSMPK
jgi:ketosteroid isomerase-like protein